MAKAAMELGVEEDEEATAMMGSYCAAVRLVEDAAAEILFLWSIHQPAARKHNYFVRQSSLALTLDACGHLLSICQSPSCMGTPGVTGAVVWDCGVVLAKFMEHAVDSKRLLLQGRMVVELGSGCGLVGCVAALLGANVILTDVFDRLRLLKKNVDANLGVLGSPCGSASVRELIWGDDLEPDLIDPQPDFVLGSDVIYSEESVDDLLHTIRQLSGHHTTVFLAGELRNDAVLECFLEAALKDFQIGHIDHTQWHPEFCSHRVALFVLARKSLEKTGT
ncbi:hypothetical protein AXF42_Ash019725 [Apostasia shenzhenica]|uniref:Protein N-lysine methyltransferase METTL21A n=1 Tax=Apostasia shenzhenica TaxID=1088818 RepID=A0A2H9ZRP0_9ASPA|nr:hypothetical protein AXF42_Ash019725 [Apostasia shenzhenica]